MLVEVHQCTTTAISTALTSPSFTLPTISLPGGPQQWANLITGSNPTLIISIALMSFRTVIMGFVPFLLQLILNQIENGHLVSGTFMRFMVSCCHSRCLYLACLQLNAVSFSGQYRGETILLSLEHTSSFILLYVGRHQLNENTSLKPR